MGDHVGVRSFGNNIRFLKHILRSAIDNALKDGGSSPSFVNDGEGFYTAVVCLDDQEKFAKLAVPYTEDFAKAHDELVLGIC